VAPDRSYADYREMAEKEAAREDGVDAVVIATPPQLHKDVAIAFMERGIEVICEKPLTRDAIEATALAEAVARTGRIFVLTHCYSGFPMVRHARDLVGAGALGRVRIVEAEFAGGAPGVAIEPEDPARRHWRFRPGSMGKSAILGEIGTHAYHLMSYVAGAAPARVSARMQIFAERREVYDNAYLTFEYASGAVGRLWASYVATGTQHGFAFRVFGDEAALEWREEDPEFLRFRPMRGPEKLFRSGQDETSGWVARSARFRPGHPEGYVLAFANLYVDAAFAIIASRTGGNPTPHLQGLPGVSDGVMGMRMIEAATASHESGGGWRAL
jgi:predicted dehydrogenase